jgi:leader peptidase (prepilin peptidase) / N-methyltransferase
MIAIALLCASISAFTDLRTGLIYDAITLPAVCAIAIAAANAHALTATLEGALLCGGALLGLHAVTHGRGIGLGDVKLATVIGAGFGGFAAIEAIAIAFIGGAICALALLALGRVQRTSHLPFAPFLAIGAIAFACGVHV